MCPFLNDMMQIIQLKGKDKHLYRLLAPLVMDPEVIRANNNYPFKTGEEYVWFIAIEDKEVNVIERWLFYLTKYLLRYVKNTIFISLITE